MKKHGLDPAEVSAATENTVISRDLKLANIGNSCGIPLGGLNGKAVVLPTGTMLNKHIAVYGATGTMKSRAFVRPYCMTATSEIDLTKSAHTKCIYFCIISDQDSTLDFLSGLYGYTSQSSKPSRFDRAFNFMFRSS